MGAGAGAYDGGCGVWVWEWEWVWAWVWEWGGSRIRGAWVRGLSVGCNVCQSGGVGGGGSWVVGCGWWLVGGLSSSSSCVAWIPADGDGDNFAPGGPHGFLNSGFRGSDFRGGDCDDSDATIYPGRKTTTHPASVDHNCNGIYGSNAEVWCAAAIGPPIPSC